MRRILPYSGFFVAYHVFDRALHHLDMWTVDWLAWQALGAATGYAINI